MNALLVTLLLAVPPALPPMPNTVEESCDAKTLAPMLSLPAKQAAPLITNVDRRIQIVLAAEREIEAKRKEPAPASTGRRDMIVSGSVLLVALVLGLVAARRKSFAGAGAAWGLAAIGVVMGAHHVHGHAAVLHHRAEDAERQLMLTQCRLQLNEARDQIHHSMLSKTIHDLDEVDEDLAGWEAKMRAGTPVVAEDLAKMRHEIQESLRP